MDHHSSEDALAILIRKSLESLNHESRICATHGDGDPGSDEVLVSANSIDKETQAPRAVTAKQVGATRSIVYMLPEILSEVAELAFCDHKVRHLEHFQLVCKAFRDVALHTPRLWAYIDDRMSAERLDLQLSRSASVGLSVKMSYHEDILVRDCKCKIWSRMISSGERWTHAKIIAKETRFPVEHSIGIFRNDHQCFRSVVLNLPSLTSLVLNVRLGKDVPPLQWEMPSLKNLVLTTNVGLPLPLSAPLEKFAITYVANNTSLNDFVEFLWRTQPLASSVTDLSLIQSILTVEQPPPAPRNDVSLCALKKLSVTLGENSVHMANGIMVALERLICPNITEVDLCVYGEYATNRFFWFWLIHLSGSTPWLEVVNVNFIKCETLPPRARDLASKLFMIPSPPLGSQQSQPLDLTYHSFLKERRALARITVNVEGGYR